MSLQSSLSIATSGLFVTNNALSVVGQNVANAGTADWTDETAEQESVTFGGQPGGAFALPTGRALDTQLQTAAFEQNATVAGLQTQQNALSGIDQIQGATAAGTDLASLVGKLQDAFSTLESDPSVEAQQQAVVEAASSVTTQINALADAVDTARQTAQNNAVGDIANLNTDLVQVSNLNAQIVDQQVQGQSVADLQNQRDAVVDQISQIVPVTQVPQSDGSVQLVTTTGLPLPTAPGQKGLSLSSAIVGPSVGYPADSADVPGVYLNGEDVTGQLRAGGSLGADLNLRDTTLPAFQAGLDEFAYTLANRFAAQGLTLFTDPSGNLPTQTGPQTQDGYIGFAQTITVNPAVAAEPSLVRDGTQDVAGSATGASAFTTNPPGGPAGFDTLIERVLDFALSDQVQQGVEQPAPSGTGLGPGGDQNAGFAPPSDLGGFATALVGQMSDVTSTVNGNLTAATSLQSSLQAKLSSVSGVSMDAEMSKMIELQNAYGANAKVISTVQAMWDALLNMIQ